MSKKRYDEIVETLNTYNYHYYTLDNPLVSDKEYDAVYDELIALEKAHPEWVTEQSPSQRVGGEVLDAFEKKEHTTPLFSLDKAQTYDELRKFFDDVYKAIKKPRITFTIELKFDGLTSILRYENGRFVEGRTRGNGKIGEIITAQLKTIKSIPMSIPYKGTVEFQGETYMPKDRFEKVNTQIEQEYREKIGNFGELTEEQVAALKDLKFKNARNAAGGSLRNLDTKVTASRGLDTFLYNIPYVEGTSFSTQVEMMHFFKEQNLKANPYFYTVESADEAIELIEKMVYERPSLNYDIDGMVIKVDDSSYRDLLGFTSKHPKWAIAWKFEAEQAETRLNDIIVETGRTGKITPVGLLKPVEIAGATVSRATLNNFEWIEERGLKYALGANVIVRRSNDVIPEILGVADDEVGQEITAPTTCPECGSTLVKDGVHLFCKNHEDCPAQQIGKIIHFGSRDAMNIDTFSEKTAEQLWEAGLIRNVVDLYTLNVEDLVTLERFGKRKAEKLIAAIDASKSRPLEAFLYGLGIRMVGKGTVERLLRYYDSLEKITNANVNELREIEDIGDIVAESIYEFFHDKKNIDMLSRLQDLGVQMKHEVKETVGNSFEGMVFVVTGTMPSGRNRNEIENLIKEHGGKTSKSVSAKTNFVVVGDDAGSKEEKARAIEVKTGRKIIISEDELLNMVH